VTAERRLAIATLGFRGAGTGGGGDTTILAGELTAVLSSDNLTVVLTNNVVEVSVASEVDLVLETDVLTAEITSDLEVSIDG
jgi:hypothetical protein